VAEIVALIFSGRKILEFNPEKISFGEYVFDGQELQYWKIDENRLPYGSKVEYKKSSVWIANKWLAAAVLIIIIIETLIIALLLLNTFRRKKTETSVAELNLQMEENASERTKKLEEAIEKLTAAKEFQAATATELVRLYGQQYMTSRKDRLTGLYNRVHMEEKIQEEFAYFLRNGRLFSLVISDIDFFKRVNDTFGHDAGDCLLKSIADVLQESIREFDIVARWGGEEFLFLLPEIDAEGAVILAERIRKRIEEQTYFYGNTELRATMTFGVSSIKADDTVEDVIKRADTALFDGKRNGRNRVMSA
jgi:diguanylate cyclase (GGDEF)-like protein